MDNNAEMGARDMPTYEQRLREACDLTSSRPDSEALKYLSTGAIVETSPMLDDDHVLSKFNSAAMLRTYRNLARYVDYKWPQPNSSTHYSAPVSTKLDMSLLQDLPNDLRLKPYAEVLVHEAQIAKLANMNLDTTDLNTLNFELANRNPEVQQTRTVGNLTYPRFGDQGVEYHIGQLLYHSYQRSVIPVNNSAKAWLNHKLFHSAGVFTEGSSGPKNLSDDEN